ncbi:MAG TPA: hypothetical protein VG013_19165 [Gemmataceae bacterium]|nr:hypothetical protein [Gemmataceae bacterium]
MSARFLTACLTPAALLLGGFTAPAGAQTSAPYNKLELTQKAYHKAEHYRLQGRIAQARRYYEQVKHLMPGSIYDTIATSYLQELHLQAESQAQLVQRVYQVADLVIPVSDHDVSPALNVKNPTGQAGRTEAKVWTTGSAAPHGRERTLEDRLIKLIAGTIEPESWSESGGPASMQYYPVGMALVVNQTPEVQDKVAQLLTTLRHLQDTQVAVEIRLLTVSDAFVEQVRQGYGLNKTAAPQIASQPCPSAQSPSGSCTAAAPELVFLNDSQVRSLLETAQGDRRTNIMQTPKLTVFNGQRSAISVQDQQYFVTGLNAVRDGGHVDFIPHEQSFTTGLQVSVQPVVSHDRRFVRLNLKANVTDLDTAAVPLFPVTTFVTPVFEGGAQGQPVPFTQYIQQPKFVTLALDKTVSIPDGATVLLSGWKKPHEVRSEVPNQAPPVLSKIPYINRLFKNVGYGTEAEHVLVMVTPRIIVNQEEEVAQTQPKAADHPTPVLRAVYQEPEHIPCFAAQGGGTSAKPVSCKVAKLLKDYQEACAEGRYSAATQLAVQALAIDPACFSKNNTRGKKSSQSDEQR